MTSELSIPPVCQRLTRPQALVLCALLGLMTLVMGWFGFYIYKVSLPPVYMQVRDDSLVGRSFAAVRFWNGEPDAESRAEGWDATYSFTEFPEQDGVAALKVGKDGRIIECRNLWNEQYARYCSPTPAKRTLLSR